MIYIFVANLYEAKPFLKRFQLQKDESQDKLEVYCNDRIQLLITRSGFVAPAISAGYFLAQRRPSTSDIVVNVQLCDSTREEFSVGSLYLGYKVIEFDTNKRFIPDLLFEHPFEEAGISSACLPLFLLKKKYDSSKFETELFDMEAVSILQALLALFATHHIYLFRIVAGHGENERRSPVLTEKLIEQHVDSIMEYIFDLQYKLIREYDFELEEIRIMKNFSKFLMLSPVKEQELFQIMYFYKSENRSMTEHLLEHMEKIQEEDIFTRMKGIKYYDEFIKSLAKVEMVDDKEFNEVNDKIQ